MALFDRFVVVDWSANSAPKRGRDSIWIAVRDAAGVSVENLATRSSAEALLAELLVDDPVARTLIGVDFSLGYPRGTAAALGLDGEPWAATWSLLAERVRDDHRNANNRFDVAAELNRRLPGVAGPFWGCPPSRATASLTATRPPDDGALPAWRTVEQVLRDQGHRPFSAWQLLGAGAVGSQSLVGIPVIERLRRRFPERVAVWPFTTGLRVPDVGAGTAVVVEVWPSLLRVDTREGVVRDAAQVDATVGWLADTDAAGGLADVFSPAVPPGAVSEVASEEGWVLGVVG